MTQHRSETDEHCGDDQCREAHDRRGLPYQSAALTGLDARHEEQQAVLQVEGPDGDSREVDAQEQRDLRPIVG